MSWCSTGGGLIIVPYRIIFESLFLAYSGSIKHYQPVDEVKYVVKYLLKKIKMVRVEGFEPPALGTGNPRSIQLSYTRTTGAIITVILVFGAVVIGPLDLAGKFLLGLRQGDFQNLQHAFGVLAAHADARD